jgi:hypothetical protein
VSCYRYNIRDIHYLLKQSLGSENDLFVVQFQCYALRNITQLKGHSIIPLSAGFLNIHKLNKLLDLFVYTALCMDLYVCVTRRVLSRVK